MWRGFGAETESEPQQRGYFRPRISSISGVLAMTKQRLFTSAIHSVKDDIEAPHTSSHITPTYNASVNPSVIEYGYDSRNGMVLSGLKSTGRSSFGDVLTYPRSSRPSLDSLTAHAVYGSDHLGNYYDH